MQVFPQAGRHASWFHDDAFGQRFATQTLGGMHLVIITGVNKQPPRYATQVEDVLVQAAGCRHQFVSPLALLNALGIRLRLVRLLRLLPSLPISVRVSAIGAWLRVLSKARSPRRCGSIVHVSTTDAVAAAVPALASDTPRRLATSLCTFKNSMLPSASSTFCGIDAQLVCCSSRWPSLAANRRRVARPSAADDVVR